MKNHHETLLTDRSGAAKILGVSLGTIHNMEREGRLTPIRVGKRGRRYPIAYLKKWIEDENRKAGNYR